MAIFNESPVAWAFGFYTKYTTVDVIDGEKNEHVFVNLTNALSWFPVLAIISTVYQIVRCCESSENPDYQIRGSEFQENLTVYNRTLVARAIAGAIGLGPILFIIDIIVSLGRACDTESAYETF